LTALRGYLTPLRKGFETKPHSFLTAYRGPSDRNADRGNHERHE